MKNACRITLLSVLLISALPLLSFNGINEKTIDNFKLRNVNGKYVSLKDYHSSKGLIVVFTCNHCPFAKLYPPRLNDLNKKYKPLGVPVIAICATDTVAYAEDSYAKMVAKAKSEHFNFPYLFDGSQAVAKNFAARKTPQAYVLWNEGGKWVVKYSGAIDDNGANPDKVKNRYVADAVDELLNGKEVIIKETKSIGCQLNYRP